MRLLIDARTLGRKPSGIGMYLYRFAVGLAGERDMELLLASDVAESAELRRLAEQERVSLRTYGKPVGKGPSVWRYAAFLGDLVEEMKPDIFWEPNNLLPVRFRNPYGKYVVTIHDIFPVTMPECYGHIYPAYFRYGLRKTVSCCDGILFDTESARTETEHYFRGVAGKPGLVGYAVVQPVLRRAEKRGEYFFYIGNLERRKGTDMLLAAYEKYLGAGGTRELYLAGKVREKAVQRQLDAVAAKTDKLHYLGYIDADERDRYYSECAAFVFPSRAEGFGIPLIEALSCGTAVLASDLPVFREIAGDFIRFFELDDDFDTSVERLAQALLETESASDGDEKRRSCAERYTAERLLPQIVHFFEELLK